MRCKPLGRTLGTAAPPPYKCANLSGKTDGEGIWPQTRPPLVVLLAPKGITPTGRKGAAKKNHARASHMLPNPDFWEASDHVISSNSLIFLVGAQGLEPWIKSQRVSRKFVAEGSGLLGRR